MTEMHKKVYAKRGEILVKNLKKRHFDAYYCDSKEEALSKALELIPKGATVGWGGVMSASQIGLLDALRQGNYNAIDRERCTTQEEKLQAAKDGVLAGYLRHQAFFFAVCRLADGCTQQEIAQIRQQGEII